MDGRGIRVYPETELTHRIFSLQRVKIIDIAMKSRYAYIHPNMSQTENKNERKKVKEAFEESEHEH